MQSCYQIPIFYAILNGQHHAIAQAYLGTCVCGLRPGIWRFFFAFVDTTVTCIIFLLTAIRMHQIECDAANEWNWAAFYTRSSKNASYSGWDSKEKYSEAYYQFSAYRILYAGVCCSNLEHLFTDNG